MRRDLQHGSEMSCVNRLKNWTPSVQNTYQPPFSPDEEHIHLDGLMHSSGQCIVIVLMMVQNLWSRIFTPDLVTTIAPYKTSTKILFCSVILCAHSKMQLIFCLRVFVPVRAISDNPRGIGDEKNCLAIHFVCYRVPTHR